MKKIVTIIISIGLSIGLFADCDMMGMVSKRGNNLSNIGQLVGSENDPQDFINWLRLRSHGDASNKDNPDGYGILYYPEDGSFIYDDDVADPYTQAWYLMGIGQYYDHYNPSSTNNIPLDTAEDVILNNNTEATLVLGHARKGTGGTGNHPFRFQWNGKTYTFEHNGDTGLVGDQFEQYLESINFNYDSNWNPTGTAYSSWVDSEVMFHYIMSFIIEENGNVYKGIFRALTNDYTGTFNNSIADAIEDGNSHANSPNIINFALSDGKS